MKNNGPVIFNHPVNFYQDPRNKVLSILLQTIPLLERLIKKSPSSIRKIFYREWFNINERIVEAPFALAALGDEKGWVIDLGCCESLTSLQLASLGYKVIALDYRPYGMTHPALNIVRGDFCALPIADNSIDTALAVSSLEHTGLGHYGDPDFEKEGDQIAFKEMWRILKPGGKAIIAQHYGRFLVNQWFRIYDAPYLEKLLKPFQIEKINYVVKRGDFWFPASQQEAEKQGVDFRGRPIGGVLIIARKPKA